MPPWRPHPRPSPKWVSSGSPVVASASVWLARDRGPVAPGGHGTAPRTRKVPVSRRLHSLSLSPITARAVASQALLSVSSLPTKTSTSSPVDGRGGGLVGRVPAISVPKPNSNHPRAAQIRGQYVVLPMSNRSGLLQPGHLPARTTGEGTEMKTGGTTGMTTSSQLPGANSVSRQPVALGWLARGPFIDEHFARWLETRTSVCRCIPTTSSTSSWVRRSATRPGGRA